MDNNTQNVDFKQLSTKDQIDTLENVYNSISQNIYKERSQDILSGKIEIIDISYNETSDNKIAWSRY